MHPDFEVGVSTGASRARCLTGDEGQVQATTGALKALFDVSTAGKASPFQDHFEVTDDTEVFQKVRYHFSIILSTFY